MSEAARRITSNSFQENDADTNDNAILLGDRSQCQGCTLLRQELMELRETVFMLSCRVQAGADLEVNDLEFEIQNTCE